MIQGEDIHEVTGILETPGGGLRYEVVVQELTSSYR